MTWTNRNKLAYVPEQAGRSFKPAIAHNSASFAMHAYRHNLRKGSSTFAPDAPLRDDPRFVIVDIAGTPPPGRSALERGR